MKHPTIPIELIGPSGQEERWSIERLPLPRTPSGITWYGDTDWIDRIVKINSRLRNPDTISLTLLHEIVHVTAGQHADDSLAHHIELNFKHAMKALRGFS